MAPQTPPPLAGGDDSRHLLAACADGDVLVHHPYDSFATSVEAFVEQAASDPAVLAIKQTIYRTGGAESRHRRARSSRPPKQGKQVVALVELKARFDEQANIERARVLGAGGRARRVRARRAEDARQGAARRAPGGRRHPPLLPHRHRQLQPEDRHASTKTSACSSPTPSSAPTSPSSSTTSPATAARASYRKLLVAPSHAARRADATASTGQALGPSGRIMMKMNALVDPEHDRRAVRGVAARRAAIDLDRARHLLPARRACPGCRRTSACARSSGGSSSTPGSTGSVPVGGAEPSTSSARPTSCPATSTAASRRCCPSPTPACAPVSPRCCRSTSPTTCSRGSSSPTARGTRSTPSRGIESQVRFQELAVARAKVRSPDG